MTQKVLVGKGSIGSQSDDGISWSVEPAFKGESVLVIYGPTIANGERTRIEIRQAYYEAMVKNVKVVTRTIRTPGERLYLSELRTDPWEKVYPKTQKEYEERAKTLGIEPEMVEQS